jgi:hypothetical protein
MPVPDVVRGDPTELRSLDKNAGVLPGPGCHRRRLHPTPHDEGDGANTE